MNEATRKKITYFRILFFKM